MDIVERIRTRCEDSTSRRNGQERYKKESEKTKISENSLETKEVVDVD